MKRSELEGGNWWGVAEGGEWQSQEGGRGRGVVEGGG